MSSFITPSIVVLSLYILVQILTEPKRNRGWIYSVFIVLLIISSRVLPLISVGDLLPFRHWTFLIGPLLLYYTYASIGRNIRLKDLLHFLPALCWWGIYIFLYLGSGRLGSVVRIYGITNLVSLIFYGLLILYVLRKNSRALKEQYSFSDIFMEIRWLSYIAVGLVLFAIALGVIVSIFSPEVPQRPHHKPGEFVNPATINHIHNIAILIFTFVFSTMAQKQNRVEIKLLKPLKKVDKQDSLENNIEEDTPQEKQFKKLCDFMSETKIYLSGKLTLQQLATEVNINKNELSALINSATGQNFFHFVNGYRSRAFKEGLVDKKWSDFTLLAIAFECGFNSKSTFNVAVKREFGSTPSQIRKELCPTL